ncbi:MAG: NAD(P)H-hydrate dehydratase [Dehalococcoidales bacterium]|nr:NAD(P)H-hydrate dehydratase [Dehalococcoidales bacterium]
MKIVSVAQMQQAERDCSQFGISLDQLMQVAGKAVAEEVHRLVGDIRRANILVLIGPGNNGGDGLVAARHLYDWGAGRIKVYLCERRKYPDVNLEEVKKRGIHYCELQNDVNFNKFSEWLSEAGIVLDAVFGTGKSRPLTGTFAHILGEVNEARRKRSDLRVIALDLPSGLNADSGLVDPSTPSADNTITLGFPKTGLYNLPGAEKAGKISLVDIGIPHSLVDHIQTRLLGPKGVKAILPGRSLIAHKGTHGKIMALTGSINYPGAAYLACSSTLRVGAGLTTLAIARSLYPVLAVKLTEVTYVPLPESSAGLLSTDAVEMVCRQLPQYDVLLAGCGSGQSQPVKDLIESLLVKSSLKLPRVVLDADGINILAGIPEWWKTFKDNAVLTPHAGEMSRLLGRTVTEVQSDRISLAREAAAQWHKTVVLKGAYTVIAAPDGRVNVSPFANAGLASAGTGDVLAGAVAGMAAQGLELFEAASCAVYVHALAGEMVKEKTGDAGMLAGDLLPFLPLAIRQLKEN